MNGFANIVLLMLFVPGVAGGSDQAVIESVHATQDVALDLDPRSDFWRTSRPVYMEEDGPGKTTPRYPTEVRTRWTKRNLYLLLVCPYEELHLKPAPNPQKETNELGNWDVAEVFVGSDCANIKRYMGFEISPQGEWVDLDIDLSKPHHELGWTWNSGFGVKARMDEDTDTWHGAMRILLAAVDARFPIVGNTMRINLFSESGAAFPSASGNGAASAERLVSPT
jgi:hypothetical protein